MRNLTVKAFPIRTNVYTGGIGKSTLTTMDGGYSVEKIGTTILLKPFYYYSNKPEITFTADVRSSGGSRLNNYEPIAVYEKFIAYVPDEVIPLSWVVISKENPDQILKEGTFEQPFGDTVAYSGFCMYRGTPSYFEAVLNYTFEDKGVNCGIHSFFGNDHVSGQRNLLIEGAQAAVTFGLGIASFNQPQIMIRPASSEENLGYSFFDYTKYDPAYYILNKILTTSYNSLARVAVSPLVQYSVAVPSNLILDDNLFVVSINEPEEQLYTRGVKIRIQLPRYGRDTIDGTILDNLPANVSVLNYWTNGNNFGVIINYPDLDRTYLWIAALGNDLTAAVINYNF